MSIDDIKYRESKIRLDFNRSELEKLSKEDLLDFASGMWFMSSLLQKGTPAALISILVKTYKEYPHIDAAAKTIEIIEDIQKKQEEWLKNRTESN